MKSAVAALGLFAVMANAYHHHPRHFHFRRDNVTTPDAGLTTLTVIATQVETVTSCAPTVPNCPAKQTDIDALPESQKATVVVTNTVVLTETVCPVSEAPAISSSVISEADAGKITGTTLTAPLTSVALTPSVPLSTGVAQTTAAPGTTAAPDALTTLTVIATEVSTVISCAPTVPNCPAKQTDIDALPETQKATVIVTNTVVLTETVCPVSEVPAISSSVISDADAGKITGSTLTAPLTTSVPDVTTSKQVETKSLTFTQGTGISASVVTSTYVTTIVHTVPCNGGCGGAGKTETAQLPTAEPTTTTTATSTGTTTVTVPESNATEQPPKPGNPGKGEGQPPKPGKPGKGEEKPGKPGNGAPGSGAECECPAPATVTVTAPASTVYVTMGAPAPSATGVSENEGEEAEDDEDDYEDDDDCVVEGENTTTLKTTLTVEPTAKASSTVIVTSSIAPSVIAPFPTGKNGTTSGVAAPTGLAHLRY